MVFSTLRLASHMERARLALLAVSSATIVVFAVLRCWRVSRSRTPLNLHPIVEPAIHDTVTIIITTSPSPVHPSLELIEAVLMSISDYAPELVPCRIIVVCDGAKETKKNAFRSAKVDSAAMTAYNEYKERLHELAARLRRRPEGTSADVSTNKSSVVFPRIEVFELSTNHGFGFAVRRALADVTTPAVCVIQHDRTFLRRVDVRPVVRAILASDGKVGYVLMPTRSTGNYVHQQRSRLGEHGIREDIEPLAIAVPSHDPSSVSEGSGKTPHRLLPCLTWFDSTHIATTQYYLDFVFGTDEKLVTKGRFIEAELGQIQFKDVCARGVAASLPRWRTYLYDDRLEAPIVGHLDGSKGHAFEALVHKIAEEGTDPSKVTGRLGRRTKRDLNVDR